MLLQVLPEGLASTNDGDGEVEEEQPGRRHLPGQLDDQGCHACLGPGRAAHAGVAEWDADGQAIRDRFRGVFCVVATAGTTHARRHGGPEDEERAAGPGTPARSESVSRGSN